MKDAKVTIKRVEDKGQYKARVTIEILKPIPKTAKFFTVIDPYDSKDITLNGRYNKVFRLFDTEERGIINEY